MHNIYVYTCHIYLHTFTNNNILHIHCIYKHIYPASIMHICTAFRNSLYIHKNDYYVLFDFEMIYCLAGREVAVCICILLNLNCKPAPARVTHRTNEVDGRLYI